MSALGDLVIMAASWFVATLFWAASRDMGRAKAGTRIIGLGLFVLAISAAFDAAELIGPVNPAPWFGTEATEIVGYLGYTAACAFLVAGFIRWLPLLKQLDGEVAGRARAEREHQNALERARRFNTGLEALGRTHIEQGWDIKTLPKQAAQRLSGLLGCQRVSIWRLEPGGGRLVSVTLYDAGVGEHQVGADIPRAMNPAYFEAIEKGRTVCVFDAINDPATEAFGPNYLTPLNIGAMLDAPIRTGRGVRGVVCCEHVGGIRHWTPEEISLATSVAQYLAVAYMAENSEILAEELKLALRQAETASAAKSVFLANMSHELRTPLNGVLGLAQSMDGEALTPDQASKVDTIISSGRTLLGVLNDVLDMSKIEAGRMELRSEPVDPDETLRQVCLLFEGTAAKKGLALTYTQTGLPAQLECDPVRVRQVITNLVSNAVKFTASGTVSVTAEAAVQSQGDWRVKVVVDDTGCGISKADQARLFNRFSQADNSNARHHGGTGLGLSIARELARRMGGDVTVDSEPGQGSRFCFEFNAKAVQAVLPDPVEDGAETPLTGARVLLVDDNEVNRIVARCFVEPNGAVVVEAEDGPSALTQFADQAFDLVLLDVHMPGMDGLETLAKLRTLPRGDTTPVIAMTADAMSGDRARFLAAGMDGYVAKPVDQADLIEACITLLASGRGDRAAKRTA